MLCFGPLEHIIKEFRLTKFEFFEGVSPYRLCGSLFVGRGWIGRVSRWVFNNSNSSLDECARNCANNCGNNARNNSALRAGLFGSVAPLKGNNFVQV